MKNHNYFQIQNNIKLKMVEKAPPGELNASDFSELMIQANKKQYQKVFEEIKSMDHINILFLIDVTGSMERYQQICMESINDIAARLYKLDKYIAPDSNFDFKFKIKFGFIAYRDKTDEKQIEIQNFTEDLDLFKQKIESLECDGGDDNCEDIKKALQEALSNKINWTSMFKYIILVADSPCHGSKYHSPDEDDNYPEDDMTNELIKIAEKNIIFVGLVLDDSVSQMYTEIKNVMVSHHGNFFSIDTNDLKNIKKGEAVTMNIINIFVHRISGCIEGFSQGSMIRHLKNKRSSALYLGSKNNITHDWQKDFKESEFHPSEIFNIYSITPNLSKLNLEHIENLPIELKLTSNWNAELQTSIYTSGSFRDVYLFKVIKDGKEYQYLAKAPKGKNSYSSKQEVLDEWRSNVVARHMAKKFKSKILEKILEKAEYEILFNEVLIAEKPGFPIFYAVERVIQGPFTKYNNNFGWVADFSEEKDKKSAYHSFNKVAQAFSHFTFQNSNGNILVADLQGVLNKLTDPVVLTKNLIDKLNDDEKDGNLGKFGMVKFFESHKCNHICKAIELELMKMNDADKKKIEAGEKKIGTKEDLLDTEEEESENDSFYNRRICENHVIKSLNTSFDELE